MFYILLVSSFKALKLYADITYFSEKNERTLPYPTISILKKYLFTLIYTMINYSKYKHFISMQIIVEENLKVFF